MTSADSQREITLSELVLLIWQHWRQLAWAMVLGLVVGGGVSKFFLPRWFEARALFVGVGTSRLNLMQNLGGLGAIAGQLGLSGLGGTDATLSPYFYADLVKTDTILRQLANVQIPDSANPAAPGKPLRVILKIGGKSTADSIYRATRRLRGMIVVDLTTRTGVIKVTFTARRPYVAALAADTLLGLVNGFVGRDLRTRAGATRRFLQDRLDQIEIERVEAQNKLQRFLETNREYKNSPSLSFQQAQLQREMELKRDLYTSVARSLEEARMNEARDTPAISVIDRPRMPTRSSSPNSRLNGAVLALLAPLVWLAIILFRRLEPLHARPPPVRKRTTARVKRVGWQLVLAMLAALQVFGTFTAFTDSLYLLKWVAGVGIGFCFFLLGHCRISRELSREFAMLTAILVIGLVAQFGDAIDGRAFELALTYTLTGCATFLVAPAALRRRSVQRIVWPGLLLGVTLGTLVGEYLGMQDLLSAISTTSGRLRYFGAFYQPNAAGTAGLIGLTLAAASIEARRRWWYLGTLPIFVAVMILADSRGSLLAAMAFAAALPLLRLARWPPQRVAITLCLGAIGMVVVGTWIAGRMHWPEPGQWQPELNRISTGRLTNWGEALGYLESPFRWMFGLGLSRNFSFTFLETDFPVPVRGSNADNFFVDLLGRTGLVGLGLFLAIIASLALKLWRGLRQGPPRSVSRCVLGLAVLISTVVLGATNSIIFTWAWLQAIVAWPLIGATATHAARAARTDRVSRAPAVESTLRAPPRP